MLVNTLGVLAIPTAVLALAACSAESDSSSEPSMATVRTQGQEAAKKMTRDLRKGKVAAKHVVGSFSVQKADDIMITYPDAVLLVPGEDGGLNGSAIGYPVVDNKGRSGIKSVTVPLDGVFRPIGSDELIDKGVLYSSDVDASGSQNSQLFFTDPHGNEAGQPFSEKPIITHIDK